MVEGVGPEAPALHGGRIRRSRRLMVLTGTFPQRAAADGGEAGQEVPAVGVQLVGREAQSVAGVEGAKAMKGRGDREW